MPDVPVPPDGGQVLPAVSNLELVARLRKNGCSGVLWLQTVDRLVGYGVGTLHRLLLDGSINAKLARLGRPVQLSAAELEHLAVSQEERDDLVRDAVFTGLLLLRDRGITDGTWSPERGADLMTYFVNACLLALPNIVGSWRTRRAKTPPTVLWRRHAVRDVADVADPVVVADVLDRLAAHDRGSGGLHRGAGLGPVVGPLLGPGAGWGSLGEAPTCRSTTSHGPPTALPGRPLSGGRR